MHSSSGHAKPPPPPFPPLPPVAAALFVAAAGVAVVAIAAPPAPPGVPLWPGSAAFAPVTVTLGAYVSRRNGGSLSQMG